MQGDDPSSLNILNQAVNGQKFGFDEIEDCATCGELNSKKKCTACKMVRWFYFDVRRYVCHLHRKREGRGDSEVEIWRGETNKRGDGERRVGAGERKHEGRGRDSEERR